MTRYRSGDREEVFYALRILKIQVLIILFVEFGDLILTFEDDGFRNIFTNSLGYIVNEWQSVHMKVMTQYSIDGHTTVPSTPMFVEAYIAVKLGD